MKFSIGKILVFCKKSIFLCFFHQKYRLFMQYDILIYQTFKSPQTTTVTWRVFLQACPEPDLIECFCRKTGRKLVLEGLRQVAACLISSLFKELQLVSIITTKHSPCSPHPPVPEECQIPSMTAGCYSLSAKNVFRITVAVRYIRHTPAVHPRYKPLEACLPHDS